MKFKEYNYRQDQSVFTYYYSTRLIQYRIIHKRTWNPYVKAGFTA